MGIVKLHSPFIMNVLESLNNQQQEAVLATNGPVLIIAGAGSGKTKALTHRIANLIINHNVSPWNILAVTFTNKAANEMKERLAALLNVDLSVGDFYNSSLPTMGTFHSICVRILRKEIHNLGYENSFVIYDSADQLALIKQIMKDLHINDRKFNPKAILSHISGAKNQLIDSEEYRKLSSNVFTDNAALVYNFYQKALEKSQALDFDDIIFKTVTLFRNNPEILEKYQDKFKYISVDEYQDTNHAQYTFVNLLANKYKNICVVGDDWQSIYSWRGADIQNILDFHKDYPEAKIIKLEQNYRSTQNILDAADSVIKKNRNRTDKKLWTENNEGNQISVVRAEDERHEAEHIAREIERRCTDFLGQKTYKDFVVLYRTNAQSRTVEEMFMRYGIPYKIVGGVKFYERKEIKDMLAYLRLILNPSDSVSFLRVINVPARKIGDKTIGTLQEFARMRGYSLMEAIQNLDQSTDFNETKKKSLQKFQKLIDELRKVNREFSASGVIKHVLVNAGYKDYLLADGSPEGEVRFENVQELISVASKYDALEPGISLATFLEEVALISDLDEYTDKDRSVTLMTLHAAKGLEFSDVFICGLEEGVFPHSRCLLDPSELEEERRLMYVGITRAKENLTLLCSRRRLLYGESRSNSPSQFLSDIPQHLTRRLGFEASSANLPQNSQFFSTGLKPVPLETNVTSEETVFSYDAIDSEFFSDKKEEHQYFHSEKKYSQEAKAIQPEANLQSKSNFLSPDEINVGDNIEHKTFGKGTILNVTGGIVTIAFKDPRVGVKKLALSVAPIVKLD